VTKESHFAVSFQTYVINLQAPRKHNRPSKFHTKKSNMVLKQLSSKRMLRIKKSFPGQIPPDSAAGAAIGYFDIDEIILGKDNPCHENCQVRDIKGFNLSRDSDFHLTKKLIAQQAANTKQQGYTIKTIKNSSFTDCPRQHFEKAAAHLANEASMMTVLRHKNIAKIRGIASSGTEAYYETGRHDAYFIITGEG
jgi:hypothetical protein